ncbi:hypothetical protein [Maribacter sp.]
MTTIVKFIFGITLICLGEETSKKDLVQNYIPVKSVYGISADSTRSVAFKILTNKCNVCHVRRNRKRIFTQENMSPWADDVYKQVFLKKRMPKGNKIKLTNQEYQELLTWITSTKNQSNGI